eukprot:GHRR01023729.1.p1 GENE.GHRR01023729.1~~GHRR01023729.1.p1  ORF type:complete len:301 (+),score=57.70 GHRR01023729.1:109-1011(+)
MPQSSRCCLPGSCATRSSTVWRGSCCIPPAAVDSSATQQRHHVCGTICFCMQVVVAKTPTHPTNNRQLPANCLQCPFAQRALAQAFTRRPGGRNGVRGGQMEFWGQPPLSGPSTLDATGYKSLIEAVRSACDAGDLSPPTLCRLGFHSVHIAMSAGRSWGANGGFHAYDVDHWDSGNAGIEDDISFLLQLRKERFSGITHADLFTLVGSLGPELAGGPPIAWYPGRLDSTGPGPSQPPLSAALPDGMLNATGVQTNYEMILGLTPREQVIFTGGGHSFGGAEVDASGWNGSFTAPKQVLY